MKKCRHCKKQAVVQKHWFWYCKEHFFAYYKKRIKRVLDKVDLENKKILVALSGGKDSQSLLDVLVELQPKYGYYLEWLFIKLWIGEQCKLDFDEIRKSVKDWKTGLDFNAFCKGAYGCIKDLVDKYNIKLHIFDIQKELWKSLPELVELFWKACSVCGTVKRYVMNRFAFEHWFDYIATWHNLTDNVVFIQMNIISGRYDDIYKNIMYTVPGDKDLKLVSKIKPQFWVEEEDNVLYCKLKGIDYISSDEACPLRDKLDKKKLANTHLIMQDFVEKLSSKYDYARRFVEFLRKNLKEDGYNIAKLKKSEILKECKKCGYPTGAQDGICRTCRMMRGK